MARDLENGEETPKQVSEVLLLWYSAALFLFSAICFAVHRTFRWQKKSRLLVDGSDVAAWGSLWFAFSVTMVVYNKWLLNYWEGGFDFPVTISLVHMVLKLVLSVMIVKFFSTASSNSFGSGDVKIPSRTWWMGAVPVGVTTALDIAASNAAFILINISFYTVVKSSSLIFVLLFSILYRLQPLSGSLMVVTSVICIGVLMASYGEPEFNSVGFALVLGSSAMSGLRWALTERLMHNLGSKLNSIMTIYTISPAAAVTLIPFALFFEGPRLLSSKFFINGELLLLATVNTFGAGIFAFAMIFVELALLHRTSSMTLSVIGYMKQVFQIIISVIIFDDQLTLLNLLGMLVTFLGMLMYHRLKAHEANEAALGQERATYLEVEDTFDENFEGMTFLVNDLQDVQNSSQTGLDSRTVEHI